MKAKNIGIALLAFGFAAMISSCDKECTGELSKTFTVSGFTQIDAGDTHQIMITRDSSYSIMAEGCADDVNDLQMTVTGSVLKISYPTYQENRDGLEIVITMPAFTGFTFSGAASVTISGFTTAGEIAGSLSGSTTCTMNASADSMDVNVSGQSSLGVVGTATTLKADVSGQSTLEAYSLTGLINTFVTASGQSTAKVNAGDNFTADASGQSVIYYKGNPTNKVIIETGESSVTQQ